MTSKHSICNACSDHSALVVQVKLELNRIPAVIFLVSDYVSYIWI
jgi:hypothetical protein